MLLAEIASLRAELTYAKTYRKLADDMSDANLKLRTELAANNELYSITKSDLAAVSLQYDAATAVIERLEAAARQDAEEKARLREALILARREISDHDSDYHHRTQESTIEAIRAALTCRPQAEPATNLFNKDGSMRIEGACRPQGEKSDVP